MNESHNRRVSQDVCAESDEENELKGKEKRKRDATASFSGKSGCVGSGEIVRREYYLIRIQQATSIRNDASLEFQSRNQVTIHLCKFE